MLFTSGQVDFSYMYLLIDSNWVPGVKLEVLTVLCAAPVLTKISHLLKESLRESESLSDLPTLKIIV